MTTEPADDELPDDVVDAVAASLTTDADSTLVAEPTEHDPDLVDPDGEEQTSGRSPGARRRNTIEWIVVIAMALLLAFVLRTFVVQAFWIPSRSMVPELEVQDRVLVNKLAYRFGDPSRGDLVVFASLEDDKSLIKRIVGMPGETIEAIDGAIFIDGEPLDESYLPEGIVTTGLPATEIPEGHYMMMGDNRGASRDSRVFGPVPEDNFTGRAFVRIWPLGEIHLF